MRSIWANDPERKVKASQTMSETARRLWKNPTFRRKRLVTMRRYWTSAIWRKRQSRRIRRAWNPARRSEASKKSKALWADPIWRVKQIRIFKKSFRTPAHRRKVSLRARSAEARKKSSNILKRLWKDSAFRKKKILEVRGRWADPEYRQLILKTWKTYWANPVNREKQSAILRLRTKESWANPVQRERFLRAIFKARGLRPTKAELTLSKLLQRIYPGEFKYNGNSAGVVLGGYVPDFVNVNGKKQIVELFGCYWHCCKDCGYVNRENRRRDDKIRLKKLGDLGWKSLIVWEHELKDAGLPAKIRGFVDR